MTRLTKPARETIRKRCDLATSGPWINGEWRGQCHIKHSHGAHTGPDKCKYDFEILQDDDCCEIILPKENVTLIGWDDYGQILTKNDAQFIATARTDVPLLLAEIERLEEALRKIQKRAATDLYSEACVEIERISRGELEGTQ